MKRKRRAMPAKRMRLVKLRDGYTCRYCGTSPAMQPEVKWHIDHVIPLNLGGHDWTPNLALSCSECNLEKSDKRPVGKYKPTELSIWRKLLHVALVVYYKDWPNAADFT